MASPIANGSTPATASERLVEFLAADLAASPTKYLAILAATALLWYLNRAGSIRDFDPLREPPLARPTVPVVGHILSLVTQGTRFHPALFARHQKAPIMTIPMANKRMYAINSPQLVQAAMRSKALSFEPFIIEFSQNFLGFTAAEFAVVPRLLPDFIRALHGAMLGEHLHAMNAKALGHLGGILNAIGGGDGDGALEMDNLWKWLQTTVTLATSEALYGHRNPLAVCREPVCAHQGLSDDLWAFDAGMVVLTTNVAPGVLAPRALAARGRLQAALGRFYAAGLDTGDDVAEMIKARARVLRRHGVSDTDVGRFEIAMLHVAVVNTMPTLFWLLVQVLRSSEHVGRARAEVLPLLTITTTTADSAGKRATTATVDISTLDEARAPFLTACYRETLRWSGAAVINRRVMADVSITDGRASYLLREGADVNMPAAVTHALDAVWGPDAATLWSPDRFLSSAEGSGDNDNNDNKKEAERRRAKKAAFIPFGGGKNLCPGRNFAFAENMGLLAALVVGFDVAWTDDNGGGKRGVPERAETDLAHAVRPPVRDGEGTGMRVTRRAGWEGVEWAFVSGSGGGGGASAGPN